ncbi:ZYRO0B04290p [Zygosaccharomyces rouxii]|uniref:ZYRO0B04290p n=1 Tax=Zygosaccharomyces rouxii (strain ATCC 2623 / CBS 732 / NBRC 1130 / NCYC 568 / NRRL Y-229) TaxID=559307 RepID=C5DQZ5_ZYGRC|nr:uncharacterized protein ZYRO0B04290g [Zygosaccharomyces rouxii]KAH9200245.1 P-loop containing nucleoside triphosphate hydrolase protein [Zygosaccharomyces rouxii]CAR26206.1 ZYRO0B04290p [Zygosaccharomyces rouxii]
MNGIPTTPTRVRSSGSSIPSPKLNGSSPKSYKRRNDSTTPPGSYSPVEQQNNHDNNNDNNNNNNSKNQTISRGATGTSYRSNFHLTSFYKENIRDLNQLQDSLFQKKAQMDVLLDELSECNGKYKNIEFKWEDLKEERSLKNQQMNLKNNELARLKEELVTKNGFLEQGHQLHLQQLRAKNDADINKMENEYRVQLERLKFAKVKKFENERNSLLDKVEEVRNNIITNETNLQNMLRECETNHYRAKENWLQDYQKNWKENVQMNENFSNDVTVLGQQIKTVLEPQCNEKMQEVAALRGKLQNLQNSLKQRQDDTQSMKRQIDEIKGKTVQTKRKRQELHDYIHNTKSELQQIDEILIKEETMRRSLHNELQELRGNIRVFCRIRPPLKYENPNTAHLTVNKFDDENGCQTMEIVKSNNTGNSIPQNFKFDRIFDQNETNENVFEEIGQLVQSSLDGYNVCIFAYGQTGSGKTYTMLNPRNGIIPATISHIFSWIENLKERGWNYEINCQFIEIYNENIADLLRSDQDDIQANAKHEIRHNQETNTTTVTNVTLCPLNSEEQVDGLLRKANRLRSTASTSANERSSRSHSVFIIFLKGSNHLTGEQSDGILNLVDLAGSERINSSQVLGERLRETQNINKSLSCLGDVVHALGSNDAAKRHIPFRNSKLTYLLQYSLTGNSKTLMFVNISACESHLNETLNSLRFASKVNSTKMIARDSYGFRNENAIINV